MDEKSSEKQEVAKKVSKKLRTAKRTLTESFKSSAILKQKYREKLKHNRANRLKDKRSNVKPLAVATSLENLSKDDLMHETKAKESPEAAFMNMSKQSNLAIRYFEAIVRKNVLEQYSPSASKVLESAEKLLGAKFEKEQSTSLASCRSNVVQCLAKLIHWSDLMLLQLDNTPEEINIINTIELFKNAIDELVKETCLKIQSQQQPLTPKKFNVERSRSTENVTHLTNDLSNVSLNSVDAMIPPLPPKQRSSSTHKPVAFVQPNNHTVDYYAGPNSMDTATMYNSPRSYNELLRHETVDRYSYCSTLSSDTCEENHDSSMVDVGNILDHHLNSPRRPISGIDFDSDYEELNMKSNSHDKGRDPNDPSLLNVLPISVHRTEFRHSVDNLSEAGEIPPPLPIKQNKSSFKHLSQCSSDSLDTWSSQDDEPPPLPPKQNKTQAYLDLVSKGHQPPPMDFMAKQTTQRYKGYQPNMYASSYNNRDSIVSITSTISEQSSSGNALPPSLPPKIKRNSLEPSNSTSSSSTSRPQRANSVSSSSSDNKEQVAPPLPMKAMILPNKNDFHSKQSRKKTNKNKEDYTSKEVSELVDPGNLYEAVNVVKYLSYKKSDGKGNPEIEAGCIAALVVYATEASGNKDMMFYEAFLTTYRTFITPYELLKKLLHRYNLFGEKAKENNSEKQLNTRTQRNAFFIILRTVEELSQSDVTDETLQLLMQLVYELLRDDQLKMAKLLREKILDKYKTRPKKNEEGNHAPLTSISTMKEEHTIMNFSSLKIAEQMTLLDHDLFKRIEIPEVLQWAREQSEDLCPNLSAFTDHFNKISFWTRTVILMNPKDQDREKLLTKFIRVMRHLRKMNNFNSYLAILSALDSAPIRRLEWQKQTTEGLREYCQLIDSSSSFRTYREALSEASPPCIPYLGLILQDLTFIHLGNKDEVHPGVINFSKRWQYFHILDSMRRFKMSNYEFEKDNTILQFFSNFDDYRSEEELWEKSLEIKPRVPRRKVVIPQSDEESPTATNTAAADASVPISTAA